MRAKLAWVLSMAALVAVVTGTPATAEDRTATAISEIRHESTDRSTRLVVECTGPLAYTYYSPDPLTLVVDIPEVDASRVPSRLNVATREVESVRVTSMARGDGRSLARLEVRLASVVPYQIFSKDRTLNLVFERAAEAKAAPAKEEVVVSASAKEPPTPSKPSGVISPQAYTMSGLTHVNHLETRLPIRHVGVAPRYRDAPSLPAPCIAPDAHAVGRIAYVHHD